MKKLMMMVVAGLAVLAAKADYSNQYLSWMLNSSEAAFSYAVLKSTLDPTTALTLWDTDYFKVAAEAGDTSTGAVMAHLGDTDYSEYAFFVEAYDGGNNLVAKSDEVAFDLLSAYVYQDMETISGAYGFAAAAVPEPTSGMLFLFGLASLALRRKRV